MPWLEFVAPPCSADIMAEEVSWPSPFSSGSGFSDDTGTPSIFVMQIMSGSSSSIRKVARTVNSVSGSESGGGEYPFGIGKSTSLDSSSFFIFMRGRQDHRHLDRC